MYTYIYIYTYTYIYTYIYIYICMPQKSRLWILLVLWTLSTWTDRTGRAAP